MTHRYPTPLPKQTRYVYINLGDKLIARLIQIAIAGLLTGWLTGKMLGY